MFLNLPTQNYRKMYAIYTLTNEKGEIIFFDIVKMVEIGFLEGVETLEDHEQVYLNLIDTHEDYMVLGNRLSQVISVANPKLQDRVYDIRKKLMKKDHGNAKRVMCVDTGEFFESARECANEHNLTYVQLLNHLNEFKSYKTVKGKKYKWS